MQPPTLTSEIVALINRARTTRGEQPIDHHGRTPDGHQAYELRTTPAANAHAHVHVLPLRRCAAVGKRA